MVGGHRHVDSKGKAGAEEWRHSFVIPHFGPAVALLGVNGSRMWSIWWGVAHRQVAVGNPAPGRCRHPMWCPSSAQSSITI
ncbi:hypothetical protein OsI_37587 [Oryza sativa Indica Group]|uniref:Uncharacterized protein n=1 Tax=Oryza sativa subsp. indica TaxID=39946 RepID=B8BNC0_ORYSI|nr:hypothetical protein OsI_37587 [Oryza sativa Indica Group]